MISFSMIAMTIIGGSDDLRGPVLGALLLTILSELLWANAPELYTIILGFLLIVFVRFLPNGLVGLARRSS
jgi:branched-chain amino acid transport system permease protein